MPQFDQFMFFNQILWFFIIFWIFYYFIAVIFLPFIYSNIYIKNRVNNIFLSQYTVNNKLFLKQLKLINVIFRIIFKNLK